MTLLLKTKKYNWLDWERAKRDADTMDIINQTATLRKALISFDAILMMCKHTNESSFPQLQIPAQGKRSEIV